MKGVHQAIHANVTYARCLANSLRIKCTQLRKSASQSAMQSVSPFTVLSALTYVLQQRTRPQICFIFNFAGTRAQVGS
jgi:hypothetical protein